MRVRDQYYSTFNAIADAVAHAQNKHHLSILNPAGSSSVIRVRQLFLSNLSLTAVTGVAERFEVRRIAALSAGTDITPQAHDTSETALLPSGLLVKTGGTAATNGALQSVLTLNNDEVTATGQILDYQGVNWLYEGAGVKPITLRAGEGLTLLQVTNSVVGSFAWSLVFSVE